MLALLMQLINSGVFSFCNKALSSLAGQLNLSIIWVPDKADMIRLKLWTYYIGPEIIFTDLKLRLRGRSL